LEYTISTNTSYYWNDVRKYYPNNLNLSSNRSFIFMYAYNKAKGLLNKNNCTIWYLDKPIKFKPLSWLLLFVCFELQSLRPKLLIRDGSCLIVLITVSCNAVTWLMMKTYYWHCFEISNLILCGGVFSLNINTKSRFLYLV